MELLKNLSTREVDILRSQFGESGVVASDFCSILRGVDPSRALKLEEYTNLFHDIDVRREGKVGWDRFSMHLINSSMIEKQTVRMSAIRKYVLESVFYNEIPNSVKRLYYYNDIDKIGKLIYRGRQSVVTLCEPDTMKTWKVTPALGSAPLCAQVISSTSSPNVLAVSCSDMSMSLWNMSTPVLKQTYYERLDESQTALTWSPSYSKLLVGSRSGVFSIWNCSDQSAPTIQVTDVLHSQGILDIAVVDNVCITASMDSFIKVTDLSRGQVTAKLKGHTHGVNHLSYCKEYSLLLSGGYERHPCAWMFHMNDRKPWPLIDKLHPHRDSIVGLQAVGSTPHVISTDRNGIVKVWDVRTLKCVQTQLVETPSTLLSVGAVPPALVDSMCCTCQDTNKIFVSGRTLSVLRYSTSTKPTRADDMCVSLLVYNKHSDEFLSGHQDTIKIWTLSGTIVRIFNNITTSDVTCACIDGTGRRFFVGTAAGFVCGFAWATGIQFKTFSETVGHEISQLSYVEGHSYSKIVVFSSEVWCIPDTPQSRAVNLKLLAKASMDYAQVTSSLVLRSGIVIGTSLGSIFMCDSDGAHFLGIASQLPRQQAIRCLTSISETPFVAFTGDCYVIHFSTSRSSSGDSPNKILTYRAINPKIHTSTNVKFDSGEQHPKLPFPGRCLMSGERLGLHPVGATLSDPDRKSFGDRLGVQSPPSVTTMYYSITSNELVTGTDHGWVVIYSMKKLLDFITSENINSKPQPVLDVTRMWLAHSEEISVMFGIESKGVIVTASFDFQILLWDRSGVCLASLQQDRTIAAQRLSTIKDEIAEIVSDVLAPEEDSEQNLAIPKSEVRKELLLPRESFPQLLSNNNSVPSIVVNVPSSVITDSKTPTQTSIKFPQSIVKHGVRTRSLKLSCFQQRPLPPNSPPSFGGRHRRPRFVNCLPNIPSK